MGPNTLELVLTQAWMGLRRNGLVTVGAICNIAVSLAIVGGFFMLAANLEHLASGLASEATITIQLQDATDPRVVEQRLAGDARVKATKFIPKEDALRAYAKAVNLPYRDLLGAVNNPLPNVVEVTVIQPEDLGAVAEQARRLAGVTKVSYKRDVADKLLKVADGVRTMGLALGGLMGLAALLLVSTTIQMGVHSRRREIRVMQLVGATNSFVRAPFLIEGAVEGLVGGLLAAAMVIGSYSLLYARVTESLKFVEMIHGAQFLAVVGLGVALLGIAFGVVGSLIGTRRYLRLV
jgi:cell division transport system permease protein